MAVRVALEGAAPGSLSPSNWLVHAGRGLMYRPSLVVVLLVALCLTSCWRGPSPEAPRSVVVENGDYLAPALLLSEWTAQSKPREQVLTLVNQSDEPKTIRVLT